MLTYNHGVEIKETHGINWHRTLREIVDNFHMFDDVRIAGTSYDNDPEYWICCGCGVPLVELKGGFYINGDGPVHVEAHICIECARYAIPGIKWDKKFYRIKLQNLTLEDIPLYTRCSNGPAS